MALDLENGNSQEFKLGWGKSGPVQSVQELVRNDPESVPERYIQEIGKRPKNGELLPVSSEIPTIDFSSLSSGDEDERRKLDMACKDWGFFQVINHGIEEVVLHKVKSAVSGFFELPLEEKKKYAMAPDDLQGYGQAYVVTDEQKLEWGDMAFLITQPPKFRQLKYWPTSHGFREALDQYSKEIKTVTEELLANISLLMNMKKESLLALHKEMKQGMRFNYYPACSRPDLVLGVSPHSDTTSLSLLLQSDDVTALQVRHEGGWVPVKPIPNALVVNIGDFLEIWSNGMYKSIEHRAITNEKVARISIATFVTPENEVDLEPLDSVIDNHRPKMYKKIQCGEFIRHALQKKKDGKTHIEFLKVQNQ